MSTAVSATGRRASTASLDAGFDLLVTRSGYVHAATLPNEDPFGNTPQTNFAAERLHRGGWATRAKSAAHDRLAGGLFCAADIRFRSRHAAKPLWAPLRLPGQYYEEASDLFDASRYMFGQLRMTDKPSSLLFFLMRASKRGPNQNIEAKLLQGYVGAMVPTLIVIYAVVAPFVRV